MEKLIECVPNFSEGRDQGKIDAIVGAVTEVPGVIVLDIEKDPDHNRSVLTFVAWPDAVVEAAFRCAKRSLEMIDLNHHKGEHPRMGAVDVIPFIPVGSTALADCVTLAARLGERIG
jgi:glutamate formiminotransferase